jgi:hypothetical protein
VIYGDGRSGQDFLAHKTGFSPKALTNILVECGFPIVFLGSIYIALDDIGNKYSEIYALAFKEKPRDYIKNLFNLPNT